MNMVSRVRTNVTDRIDKFTISEARVSAFRMHRQHLDLRAPSSRLPRVVGDVCGVQAQVTAMARIALWARLRQLTLDDVERALVRKRTIVKTWSMRGALHLLASNELLLYLRVLMPTRLPREQRWIEGAGLKEEETTAMILDALKNGPLTRVQLVAYLAKRLGTKAKDWMDGGVGAHDDGIQHLVATRPPRRDAGARVLRPEQRPGDYVHESGSMASQATVHAVGRGGRGRAGSRAPPRVRPGRCPGSVVMVRRVRS